MGAHSVRASLAVCLLVVCGSPVCADLKLTPLVARPPDPQNVLQPNTAGYPDDPILGPSALEVYYGNDPFEPNNTDPQLQIGGTGSVENSGGVAIFKDEMFILDLQFLNAYTNPQKISFEEMFLTAAFRPNQPNFEALRLFDPANPSNALEFTPDMFADSRAFGLPFPPDSNIKGIAVGEGDFLTLDGAIIVGAALGVGLQRDANATLPPTVQLGVHVVNPVEGKTVAIRFDVFGLNPDGSLWNVQGNDPSSGSSGYFVPEPCSLSLIVAGAFALAVRHSRRRKR